MKNTYIYEKPGPFGTLVQVVGFICLFGGMFLGHVLLEQALGGFFAGLAVFLALAVSYIKLNRNINHVRDYRMPQEPEGV